MNHRHGYDGTLPTLDLPAVGSLHGPSSPPYSTVHVRVSAPEPTKVRTAPLTRWAGPAQATQPVAVFWSPRPTRPLRSELKQILKPQLAFWPKERGGLRRSCVGGGDPNLLAAGASLGLQAWLGHTSLGVLRRQRGVASAQGTGCKTETVLFVKHGSQSDLKDFVSIYDGPASGTDQLMGHGHMGRPHAFRLRLGPKRGSWGRVHTSLSYLR